MDEDPSMDSLRQHVSSEAISGELAASQEPDLSLFSNGQMIELDQRIAAERKSMKVNVATVAVIAGAYAIAHEIDPEFLSSNILANIAAVPSLIMSTLPVWGLAKGVIRTRRLRKQKEGLRSSPPYGASD